MAEIEMIFGGFPVVNMYVTRPPEVRPLNAVEKRRRRTAEAHPQTVGKEVS